jgi:hypothetical protein
MNFNKVPVDSRKIIYSVSIMNIDPSWTDDGGGHGDRLLDKLGWYGE